MGLYEVLKQVAELVAARMLIKGKRRDNSHHLFSIPIPVKIFSSFR